METINNVASAAAKAVWGDGETNKEPISGSSGDVSKGEPYDAGNLDDAEQANKVAADQGSDKPTTHTSATTATTTTTDDVKPASSDTTAGQNDTRKPQDVDPDAEAEAEARTATGPGPKPLETVAQEHGGDAGNFKKSAGQEDEKSDNKTTGDSSESQGTGEQYVKTSGLAADGGDFDATKPGAGREADRLMEQKGLHPNGGAAGKEDSHDSSKKDKPSLGDRIKAKLHKH